MTGTDTHVCECVCPFDQRLLGFGQVNTLTVICVKPVASRHFYGSKKKKKKTHKYLASMLT